MISMTVCSRAVHCSSIFFFFNVGEKLFFIASEAFGIVGHLKLLMFHLLMQRFTELEVKLV